MYSIHHEPHLSQRNGWLRASVLGANDGLISTSSLLMGMVAGGASQDILMLTGLAALIGGALSMGAGEYISVSSQADTEKADLSKEQYELEHHPERELEELIIIYQKRGLSRALATEVATALTQHDALEAHARDEIGLIEDMAANPLQAAFASMAAFAVGAILPIIGIWLLSHFFNAYLFVGLGLITIIGLAILGYTSARLGGANILRATFRVVFWGVLAMLMTAMIGRFFGVSAVG